MRVRHHSLGILLQEFSYHIHGILRPRFDLQPEAGVVGVEELRLLFEQRHSLQICVCLCERVCVCVCVCVCMYVCMHACMQEPEHAFMHACMQEPDHRSIRSWLVGIKQISSVLENRCGLSMRVHESESMIRQIAHPHLARL
jgi:hypothetical protein